MAILQRINLIERADLERQENWDSFYNAMDFVDLRRGYSFRVIPAFQGALFRFRILHQESKREYSIYYDTMNALGIMDKPYFEVHEIEGDCFRSYEINEIMMEIYIEQEGKEAIQKDFPEYFV